MTIEKGRPWGTAFVAPLETRDVDSDAGLASGRPEDIHILTGGDVHRALGEPRMPRPGESCTLVHIDALRCDVETDSGTVSMRAASSVQIGRWLSTPFRPRRFLIITNSGIVDGRNVAPRAHPNDGFLHVMTLDATMPVRQRMLARRRSTSGNHLPHPQISVTRSLGIEIARIHPGEPLRIDDMAVKNWTKVTVAIEPDCWQVLL